MSAKYHLHLREGLGTQVIGEFDALKDAVDYLIMLSNPDSFLDWTDDDERPVEMSDGRLWVTRVESRS